VPPPKHATRPIDSRTAIALVCAKRIARDEWRFSTEPHAKIAKSSKRIQHAIPREPHAIAGGKNGPKRRASGCLPSGTALFVWVFTLSTMGACAPDVRFTVGGCTEQVLRDAASVQVSATAPANVPKESATSW